MGFALNYELRQRLDPAIRWIDDNRRAAILGAAVLLLALIYLTFFLRPFSSREMVILYRPSPDRASVVFNLGDEYKLDSIRLLALDEKGREAETLWRFDVPRDAPRLSTFSLPPRAGRGQPADNPPPPLEPGRTYRLKVSAPHARGTTDFHLDPAPRTPG